jgi:hypothetical protein
MKTFLLPLLAAAAAAPAFASPPQPGPDEQVTIPFVNHRRAIHTFEAPDDSTLYLQDRQRRWYRAELAGICFGLGFAQAIGYDTRGGLSLDRGSSILIDGQRCMITSLPRSDGPPRRQRKAKG